MARRQLLIGACRSRWRRHLRVGGRDSEQQKKRGYVRCLAHVGPPGSARGKYRLGGGQERLRAGPPGKGRAAAMPDVRHAFGCLLDRGVSWATGGDDTPVRVSFV